MIPFDFDYYKPASIDDAVNIYQELVLRNKKPLYYSGGTEIITSARNNNIETSAVIDIKEIPQCMVFELTEKELIIGSGINLSEISETNYFPLLKKVTLFPADHTTRDKLTIGGNICGAIRYKEIVLPLLIADCQLLISSKNGSYLVDINEIFNKKLNLKPGELLVQIRIPIANMNLPYYAVKIRNQGVSGYPLISFAAVKKYQLIRVSISGLCAFPFRSVQLDDALNNKGLTIDQRILKSLDYLPAPISDDIQGSSDYKRFVYKNILKEALEQLEGDLYDRL